MQKKKGDKKYNMKILIVKIGALGDVLRTVWIAQALKEKYKEKKPEIYWLTSSKAESFFFNNPYVDHVILNEDREYLETLDFDLIINLEENEDDCRFVEKLSKEEIVGFKIGKIKYTKELEMEKIVPTKTAEEWYNMSKLGDKPMNDILKKENKKTHRQLMGEIIDVKNWEKYETFLRLSENQRKFANDFKRRYNILKNELVIGINVGSADRWKKQLPIDMTSKLIDMIYEKYKCKILLFGGPDERIQNDEIKKGIHSPVIDTGCGNDMIEFPALVSVCNLMINSDSLGMHVSFALKRKTIVLIGPTSSNEIDTYGVGKKIASKSDCLCCYKKECDSMKLIDLNEIMKSIEELMREKVALVITAFKEPKVKKAIECALKQKTKYSYEVIVSAPDEETLNIARKYKEVKIFKDAGKGKSFALNQIFREFNPDIMIMTDGDVYISENAVEKIVEEFKDPEVGCLTGRPVPQEDKSKMYGYWANFLFDSANRIRRDAYNKSRFIECSGYLFAFRKHLINEIPLHSIEDSLIPYFFWERGYKIGYVPESEVYVKNVDNWKDWIKQKTRTSKGHEELNKYVDTKTNPRIKTFWNEAKGIWWALKYPKSLKESYWTFKLILARLYMWLKVFVEIKLLRRRYTDNWERVRSGR